MSNIEVAGVPLHRWGNDVQMVGVVFQAGPHGVDHVLYFPGESPAGERAVGAPDAAAWKALLAQTDSLVVPVETTEAGVRIKAFARKSERQIDAGISWAVFRRDEFRCRYCGLAANPLTVDHLVRWEVGGPSVAENLVATCRPCNRTRGDMEYGAWIASVPYRRRSAGLSAAACAANEAILAGLDRIPRVSRVRSR